MIQEIFNQLVVQPIQFQYQNNEFFAAGILLGILSVLTGMAYKFYPIAKTFFIRRYVTTVDIEDPYLYSIFSAWFADNHEKMGRVTKYGMARISFIKHGMVSSTVGQRGGMTRALHDENDEDDLTMSDNHVYYPGQGRHFLKVDNKFYIVENVKEELGESFKFKWLITYFGKSFNFIDSIVDEYEEKVHGSKEQRKGVRVFTNGRHYWVANNRNMYKTIDTIYTTPKNKKLLMDDVVKFINSKELYQTLGALYKRGYIFYGPPGTGKTSTAVAIANFLKCPIYTISLNDTNAESLTSLSNETTNSLHILLFEDIDRAVGEDNEKVPINVLLNILDGTSSKENRIVIFTTNYIEDIEKALLRPGRIDLKLYFGLATPEDVKEQCQRIVPDHKDTNTFVDYYSSTEQRAMSDIESFLFYFMSHTDRNMVEEYQYFFST